MKITLAKVGQQNKKLLQQNNITVQSFYTAQQIQNLNRQCNLKLDKRDFICGQPSINGKKSPCQYKITCRCLNSNLTPSFISQNRSAVHTCSLQQSKINVHSSNHNHPNWKPSKFLTVKPIALIASINSENNSTPNQGNTNTAIQHQPQKTVTKYTGKKIGHQKYNSSTVNLHKILNWYYSNPGICVTNNKSPLTIHPLNTITLKDINNNLNGKEENIFHSKGHIYLYSDNTAVIYTNDKISNLQPAIYISFKYLKKLFPAYTIYLNDGTKVINIYIRSVVPRSSSKYCDFDLDQNSFKDLRILKQHLDIRK